MILLGCLSNACADELLRILEAEYKRMLYEYNTIIKKWGVKLKPMHVVIARGRRYVYLGKYWYRVEYRNGKLKWIYLGSKKPMDELPDPPVNPLELIVIEREGDKACVYLRCNTSTKVINYLLNVIGKSFIQP